MKFNAKKMTAIPTQLKATLDKFFLYDDNYYVHMHGVLETLTIILEIPCTRQPLIIYIAVSRMFRIKKTCN